MSHEQEALHAPCRAEAEALRARMTVLEYEVENVLLHLTSSDECGFCEALFFIRDGHDEICFVPRLEAVMKGETP